MKASLPLTGTPVFGSAWILCGINASWKPPGKAKIRRGKFGNGQGVKNTRRILNYSFVIVNYFSAIAKELKNEKFIMNNYGKYWLLSKRQCSEF
jgi:hypothetical protein